MTTGEEIYNPLDKRHLAESIARAFFERPLMPLPPKEPFQGAGIYAIYYHGDYELYSDIAKSYKAFVTASRSDGNRGSAEQPIPIYIGKSDAPGSRKGVGVEKTGSDKDTGDKATTDLETAEAFLTQRPQHRKLYARLVKHSKSIEKTENLRLEDFACRYMLVDEIWVPLGEARLVESFNPMWNVLVEGFGSNPEGGGRKDTARPVWDILHPGRKEELLVRVDSSVETQIVAKLRAAKTRDSLKRAIDEHRAARLTFNKVQRVTGKSAFKSAEGE